MKTHQKYTIRQAGGVDLGVGATFDEAIRSCLDCGIVINPSDVKRASEQRMEGDTYVTVADIIADVNG
jgi:hypothetical protein